MTDKARPIKRKRRRELYYGDIVDPVVLFAGVSSGGEDENSCQSDSGKHGVGLVSWGCL
jgi:hypothetical protein